MRGTSQPMPRTPEFPIRSEMKPWKTRLIGGLVFVCFVGGGYIARGSLLGWLALSIAILPLWSFIRGAHLLFTLDEEAIAWSSNLKRKPATRLLLANVREVHLTEPDEGTRETEKLILIDHNGVSHIVGSFGFPYKKERIWQELRRLCPTAKFGHYRDHTAIPAPNP